MRKGMIHGPISSGGHLKSEFQTTAFPNTTQLHFCSVVSMAPETVNRLLSQENFAVA